MDKVKYIEEALKQLGDCDVYTELRDDPTQRIAEIINTRVHKLCYAGYIDHKTLDYLLINSNPKAGRFYLLPKLHKKGCPGRPVVSGCSTSTEKISEFVDFHIKSLVPSIPSYIRDTKHFLQKLNDLERLPDNAILVTADVIGSYPHEEGLLALENIFLDVTVMLNNGILSRDLFTQPTDKHQYLYHTSYHPSSCKKGIPYSQALRLQRICSEDIYFDCHSQELSDFLVLRGYDRRFVDK